MTLEAGSPIGRYVVKSKLAEGGMAEIYLATARGPEGFEKEVVIKRVRSFLSDDEGFVRMFIEEARLASRLDHANVVQIFDFDKHEDTYYLAMEYVRGCSLWNLRRRCREKGIRVPPLLVAHIGAQVAAGLHYAHRARSPEGHTLGLVHRDVTPHNVLLSFDGAVKLTDFGIAKAGNTLTQPGVLKGKFAYMAPEQARGDAVDARTDVFALGVVLWEMLTGGRLFDGDSDVAVLRAVQESVIVPPTRLNPDVSEGLNDVVMLALRREPSERYQSAGELERALAQCVLRGVTTVDDTDVGTFVRRLFDVPLTQFMLSPAVLQEHSQRQRAEGTPTATPAVSPPRAAEPSGSATRTAASAAEAPTPPAPREATAVLPGRSPSGSLRSAESAPSEASLVSASTLVLPTPRRSGPSAPAPVPTVRESRSLAPVAPAVPPAAVEAARGEAPPAPTPEAPVPAPGPVRRGPAVKAMGAVLAVLVLGAGAVLWRSSRAPPAEPTHPAVQAPAPTPQAPVPAPATPSAPEPTPPAAVAPVLAPEPSTNETPPAAPAVQLPGTLVLRAEPYADVYLDGKRLKSELQGTWSTSLAPGTYELRFVHPSRTEKSRVTITSNTRITRAFKVPTKPRTAP